ncbi:MAG TPA: alpha/beta hydrolase [Streptosporangiaceae bacterium]|nr:alpha/beta hydrolase [Streptosporangiaceae bacterium]
MRFTPTTRRARLHLIITAAVLALAGLLIPVSQIAAAGTTAGPASPRGPRPSIVLVHGAWADSSSWDAVVSRLQRAGYTVYVPPNPLLGLPYDAAFIRDFLHTISGPIVLVGHSYGGAVITNAATGDKQVKALVYVDAFAPARGQTVGQLVSTHPGSCVLPAANVTAQPYPGAPKGAVDVYVKQGVFPSCMANGLPAAQARVLAATQRPLTSLALTQKSGPPAWKTIPSWAVIGTADHAIPPAELLAMARQAGARITMAPGAPHLSMIYTPGLVTRVILRAAHATS